MVAKKRTTSRHSGKKPIQPKKKTRYYWTQNAIEKMYDAGFRGYSGVDYYMEERGMTKERAEETVKRLNQVQKKRSKSHKS